MEVFKYVTILSDQQGIKSLKNKIELQALSRKHCIYKTPSVNSIIVVHISIQLDIISEKSFVQPTTLIAPLCTSNTVYITLFASPTLLITDRLDSMSHRVHVVDAMWQPLEALRFGDCLALIHSHSSDSLDRRKK